MTKEQALSQSIFEISIQVADDPEANWSETMEYSRASSAMGDFNNRVMSQMDVNDEFTYFSERLLSVTKIKRIR